jgi:hypothetical protein
METLSTLLITTLKQLYVGGGFDLKMYFVSNDDDGVYGVVVVDTPVRKQPAGVVVLARVLGDKVVIEEDLTDRPLYQALMRQGIPRERLILAYVGEPLPDLTAQPGE